MTINFTGLMTATGQIKVGTPPPAVLPPDWSLAPATQDISVGNRTSAIAFSADGSTMAVGLERDTTGASNGGAVDIYTHNGTSWTLQEKVLHSSPASNDYLGGSVSLSADGNSLLAGARGRSGQGRTYLFTRSGSTWTQQQEFASTGIAADDNFGSKVVLSEDGLMAMISASADDDGGLQAGAVYYFTRSGNTFTQQQQILPNDVLNPGRLGTPMAANKAFDRVMMYNANAYAYQYERSGNTWTNVTAGGRLNVQTGGGPSAIALDDSGDNMWIGAPKVDIPDQGQVWSYEYTASWSNQQTILGEAVSNEYFGWSTALSGDANFAAALSVPDSGAGDIYFYEKDGNGDWQEVRRTAISADSGNIGDFVASDSMAMSKDGKTVVVKNGQNGIRIFTAQDAT